MTAVVVAGGIVLIVIGALLALGAIGGYVKRERRAATISLVVGLVVALLGVLVVVAA